MRARRAPLCESRGRHAKTRQEDRPSLAATAPPLRSVEREQPIQARERNRAGLVAVSALAIAAILIHGYHPYVEDGGLYLAGIKRVLHPDLYPYWTGFTTAHLRFSLFAPMVALLVRGSHLSLMTVMLLVHSASVWATLYASWLIATRCSTRSQFRYGAVALLAVLLAVPVAGTSLMLMDPYVSARSISTPCGLFALVGTIDMARRIRSREKGPMGSMILCLGSLLLASMVHPLMAGYALGCVVVLAMTILIGSRWQWAAFAGLGLVAVIVSALLIRYTPAPPPGYMDVGRTRTYWFVGTWYWYELAGLAAPLALLAAVRFRRQPEFHPILKSLAQMGLVAGGLAIFIALLFARVSMASYAVARLQPLRVFQTIYVITIMMVGAALAEFALKRIVWRWAAMYVPLGALMLFVQLELFPHSNHLEFPGARPSNGWEQAFLWIRTHTAKDSVVALDADYITARGEDAQNFRAIAERSAIPDYSKDGGIASIAPDLTQEWMIGEAAQKDLDRASDAQRAETFRALRADWMVLPSAAPTNFPCDYANGTAKVCRLSLDRPVGTSAPGRSAAAALVRSRVARPKQ